MIDIRKLKELVRLMVTNDLTELDLRDTEEQVTLRRSRAEEAPVVVQAPVVAPPSVAPTVAPAAAPTSEAEAPAAEAPAEDLPSIDSPMVGSFFSAADPDSPPFVKVGDQVTADTVICLVEAMKIFNEIKAERAGTIKKVLVSNGDAVEFGQPLFLIEPSS